MSRGLKHSTAEYCEIRIEETEGTTVRFRGNDIELVSQNISVRSMKLLMWMVCGCSFPKVGVWYAPPTPNQFW